MIYRKVIKVKQRHEKLKKKIHKIADFDSIILIIILSINVPNVLIKDRDQQHGLKNMLKQAENKELKSYAMQTLI